VYLEQVVTLLLYMAYKYLLTYIYLVFALSAPAQKAAVADEESFRKVFLKAPWQKRQIAPGIIWRYYHFPDLYGARQHVSVLDIDLREKRLQVKIAYRDTILLPTSTLAKEAGAIAAINGNYFHTEEGGSVCFLKVDGHILDTSRTDLTERLFLDQLDDIALIIDASGKTDLVQCPPGGWKTMKEVPTILSAGPVLISGGKLMAPVAHGFNDKRYGRSGAGMTADHHLILITVDGHTSGSAGMTIPEFARLFLAFNCSRAMNLDGGGSATMWIRGKPEKGVVSYPSDNKKFDHQGERAVANAIVIVISNN
jgi:exopolysaccharide biosynthesis protein